MTRGLLPADRDRPDPLRALMAPDLQERAAALLQAAVAADPSDAGAWKRLGDVLRRQGDFPAACEAYRRLRALRPDSLSAAWLRAIAAGDRLPAARPVGRFLAAPFVRIQNFLTTNEGERLRTWAFAARDRFVPGTILFEGPTAGTRKRRVDVSKRLGLATVPGACKEFSGWFVPKLRACQATEPTGRKGVRRGPRSGRPDQAIIAHRRVSEVAPILRTG